MTLPIRYSPSGPVIATLGTGAQLRLSEFNSTIGATGGGTLSVPVDPASPGAVISSDGFGGSQALVLTMTNPTEANLYRAELSLDVVNNSTNVDAEVVLYLDTSIDGGTTWVNRAKVMHLVSGAGNDTNPDTTYSRPVQINLALIQGSSLGVNDSVPTANLKIRGRMNLPLGTAGSVKVNSQSASDGTSVANLDGTFHLELAECLA